MFVHRHSDGKDQFDAAMSAVKASPELGGLGQDGKGQERFTSREMIAVEQRLERAAARLAERGGQGLPAAAVRGVAATGRVSLVLGTQQEAPLRHITSRNDLSLLVGFAGTVKSALMGVLRATWATPAAPWRGAPLPGVAAGGT